ncbi:hypothetical protein [Pontibacter ramchanderi]|uniref:Tetratricopeptide repeat protein n=1 Tax=Pontibacter ramchanderi TaxID=1179743 RepID=A0A2N3V178_9BACT|nr:hypothetical protein [Pontibacter ramchanderi]PKV75380.1 hypothetical protein BD749_0322 [Pontibacter ramchanderi]
MNKSAFLKLIKQVSDISDQQQTELEQVAVAFPYCQTAHLLLAKSAYDKGSMLSTQRLRRASAYATDRQLLKRLIYASPVLETVYEEEYDSSSVAEEEETLVATALAPEEVEAETPVTDTLTEDGLAEDAIPVSVTETAEESLEEVYTPAPFESHTYPTEEAIETDTEAPDTEIDSELALLFTFNSISSSSTDLLSNREEENSISAAEQITAHNHLADAADMLHDLEEATDFELETNEEDRLEAQAPEPTALTEEITETEEPASEFSTLPMADEQEAEDAFYAEEAEEPSPVRPEDAEINYSFDEIDRLYAEDALGYWMGSSRMGEVLQLKDDYTRPRPQAFHPELILEYSKTHELEKAIQPTTHVLSKQLDIIDQFLKLNPRLKTMANLKLKPEPQEDLSLKSSKIKKGMATESLANIFISQGKPKKAAKIYEQLILKYPEKKSYFAEQIEKLQNIT